MTAPFEIEDVPVSPEHPCSPVTERIRALLGALEPGQSFVVPAADASKARWQIVQFNRNRSGGELIHTRKEPDGSLRIGREAKQP